MKGIRLQLVLAKGGVASRRAAEALMQAGRVAVNGRVVSELGTRVDPSLDRITVDGNEVSREPLAYYLLNKPKGYVTTASDPEGRATVFDLLNEQGIRCRQTPGQGTNPPPRVVDASALRLFAVGRLDYNTEGALLLTNDGELAHALMHPSRGVAKIYHAKLRGEISREQILRLQRGVELPPARILDSDGKPVDRAPHLGPRGKGERAKPLREHSAPCEVRLIKNTDRHTWLEFELHEGKNRQIHRMAEAIGSSLLKLMRVSYAGLELGDLPTGTARSLTLREVAMLRAQVGLAPPADSSLLPTPQRERPRREGFGGDRPMRSGPPRRAAFGDDRPRREGPPRRAAFGDDRPRREGPPRREGFGDDRPRREGPPRREGFGDARPMRSGPPRREGFGGDRPMRSGPPRREGFGGDRPMRSGPPRREGFGDARPMRSGPPRREGFGDDRPRREGPPRREGFGGDRPMRSGPPRREGFGDDRPRREGPPRREGFGGDRPMRSGPPRREGFGDDRPRREGPPRREGFGDDRPMRSGPPRREGFGDDRPRREGPPRREGFRDSDAARDRLPRSGPGRDRPQHRPEGDDARH
ncbi:MAG: rRNA pseudouridine synthase [Myxococcales bacterium]|nr:rRNA pseudouridine synthase [Myxococcales bacterium]